MTGVCGHDGEGWSPQSTSPCCGDTQSDFLSTTGLPELELAGEG